MLIRNIRRTRGLFIVLALLAAIQMIAPSAHAIVRHPSPPVNAFFLSKLPGDYGKLEKFIGSLREGGANAIIVELPAGESGIDLDLLPNLVYLAHQAGFKLYAIVPTRLFPGIIRRHPAWEDLRYDLGSGTLQPSGKLDLFHPDAAAFLVSQIREVASYSVDAILLGGDFYYADIEGMSGTSRDLYAEQNGTVPTPGGMFLAVKSGEGNPSAEAYGDPFWKWAEFKRDCLLTVFQEIVKASLPVNPALQFGLPIPFSAPVTEGRELLAQYAYDMTAFRKLDVDFHWISIAYRDLRERQGLSYRQTMELLTRIASAAVTATKDPTRTVIALQTTMGSGKPLPYSEIEEVTESIRRTGETGRAYRMSPEALLPSTFTKKMFKRQDR